MQDSGATGGIPIIDISPLMTGETGAVTDVAALIGEACRSIGFFCIKGHGVPPSLIENVYAMSRAFFSLPIAQKEALSITRSLHNRGYVGFDAEALEPGKAADSKEAFNIGRVSNVLGPWPDLPGFAEVMANYDQAMRAVCRRLHVAFATDLGLPSAYFDAMIDDPMTILRLLHYPAMVTMEADRVGAGAHTDYGNVTILAQDAVGGLQVRTRSGDWIAAPPIPGSFVCNIGDCLMRWSNDIYLSTPHRVSAPRETDRYSIAYFFEPNADAIVQCLPGCSRDDAPPLYPPVRAADYLKSRLDATYSFRR